MTPDRSFRPLCWLALVGCLAPTLAFAHPGHDTGLIDGFAHPFLGWDHLAAMLAVGAWAWQQRAYGTALALPAAFVAAVAAGLLGAQTFGSGSIPESLVAGSLIVLGLVLGAAVQPKRMLALPVVACCGLVHGWAHGVESSAPGASLTLVGLLSATALLHGLGAAAVAGLRREWPVRLAGWTMAGAGLLGVALA